MSVRRLILALCALLLARPALADPADIAAASRGVVRVVLIQSDGTNARLIGHGTGFAVAPDLVLTNAHVVSDLRADDTLIAGVVPPQGRGGFPAQLVAYSPANDLALLRVGEGGRLPALSLFPGPVTDGEEVSAVGYPGNVDLAQGLSLGDLVSPQEAVKTRGYVSAGRSSRQYDTILHTAPIGAGNSGGPLLDSCGRVIGVNSFGTISDNGTDSAFYFAISMREVTAFLKQAGVAAHLSALPCTSIADLDRADAARATDEQARLAQLAASRAAAKDKATEQARRDAEREILSERDNGMALAALLLVAAMGAGGAGFVAASRNHARNRKRATIAALVLLLAAIGVWALRPPLDLIDQRAQDLLATPADDASASAEPAPATGADATARLVCVLDPQRSRVTVSDITDVPLSWRPDGCVNGRTQYGLADDGWSRVLVPNGEDTVSVTHFDPATRAYTVERFLMGLDAMTHARAVRGRTSVPACGSGEPMARQFGQAQQAIKALLPPEPNERMRYTCQPAP